MTSERNLLFLNLNNEDPFLGFDYDEQAESYVFRDVGQFVFSDNIRVEKFIHSLSIRNVMLLTLLSLGYSHREICEIYGFKTMNFYYAEITVLRNAYKNFLKEQGK